MPENSHYFIIAYALIFVLLALYVLRMCLQARKLRKRD